MEPGSGNTRPSESRFAALREPCICLTFSMCAGSPWRGCLGLHLNLSIMYDYLVVLEVPGLKFPESLKSYEVMASNRYAARKLAMHKYCKHAIWWAAVLKTWGP